MLNLSKIPPNEELIGKYINTYLYTDVHVMGKIVGVKGKTLTLAKVHATRDESVKLEFHVGGFSAHCSNNYAQKWTYDVDETDTFTVRYSKALLKRNRIEDAPLHFHDYNF